MKKSILATLLACIAAGNAAANVVYNEALQGDLVGSIFDYSAPLVLHSGANTVLGTSKFLTPAGSAFQFDFDSVLFSLGSGQTLESITFRVTDVSFASSSASMYSYYEFAKPIMTSPPATTAVTVSRYSPISIAAGVQFPVGTDVFPYDVAGTYVLRNNGGYSTGAGGSWAYELTFNVAAVPEPEILSMMGVGLLAVLGVAHRKRALNA